MKMKILFLSILFIASIACQQGNQTMTDEQLKKKADEYVRKLMKENPPGYADVTDVVAHIVHVVQLVGVDHVGIGSDFDGLGDSLPTGLKDVSYYPNLIFHLLKKGFSDKEIKKICGDNLLRVWSEVEQTANKLHNGKT